MNQFFFCFRIAHRKCLFQQIVIDNDIGSHIFLPNVYAIHIREENILCQQLLADGLWDLEIALFRLKKKIAFVTYFMKIL